MENDWMEWAADRLKAMAEQLNEKKKEDEFCDACMDHVAKTLGKFGIKKVVWVEDDGTEVFSDDLTKRKTYPKLKIADPDPPEEEPKPKRKRKKK